MKQLPRVGWTVLLVGAAALVWGYFWSPRPAPTEIFSARGIAILAGYALVIAGAITVLVYVTRRRD